MPNDVKLPLNQQAKPKDVQQCVGYEKQFRRRMLDKELKQKKRLSVSLSNAGVNDNVVCQILERTIESDQMATLISTLPKTLAATIRKWCTNVAQQEDRTTMTTMNSVEPNRPMDRRFKSRLKAGLVKAGADARFICHVLDKTIDASELANFMPRLSQSLASNVRRWCSVTGSEQHVRATLDTSIRGVDSQTEDVKINVSARRTRTSANRRMKKCRLKKKIEQHGVQSHVAETILSSLADRDLVRACVATIPNSLFDEVLEFIAGNEKNEENVLITKLMGEGVDSISIGRILDKTLDENATNSVIDSVSLAAARLICRWLGGLFHLLKSKERKARNALERHKQASSTEFRTARQKENHKKALERLKNVSARLRNRILARQRMNRRLPNNEVRDKNRARARQSMSRRLLDKDVRERNRLRARARDRSHDKPSVDSKKQLAAKKKSLRVTKAQVVPANHVQLSPKFNLDVATTWFKSINDHCLEFICTCCDQIHYRHTMQSITDRLRTIVKSTERIHGALTGVLSVDGKEWICKNCASFLLKRKIPPHSKLNGFEISDIEPILENLTTLEEKLVLPRLVFQCNSNNCRD